jgi:predicted transcriptional regulator
MGLFQNMQEETVSRLDLREPVLVRPDVTVRQAVQAMRERSLGCAILIDDDNKPVGMFTESMVTQMIATKPSAIDDPITKHAANRWPQVKLTDPIAVVLDALESNNVRFLAVVDADGRIAGLAGQKGLMEYVAEHYPGQVMVQRVGQKPGMETREGA